MGLSRADILRAKPAAERRAILDALGPEKCEELKYNWRFWGRPEQFAPGSPGAAIQVADWRVWYIRAGRGYGKTRASGGWLHERAEQEPGRWIAIIGKTPADVRDYQIEGPGGLLKHRPKWVRGAGQQWPIYEPSKRRLTWPNGTWATIFSSEEPEQLRGYSGDTAWLDEPAKYRNLEEVWRQLKFGMRECSGDYPRTCISTTPKPIKLLMALEKKPTTVVSVGTSFDNAANLDPGWLEDLEDEYGGTRFGRQEMLAEYLDDVPGALWTLGMIDAHRVDAPPEMARIVVAVDPAVTSNEKSDETGIVVVGLGKDGHGYVLADATIKSTPSEWAREAVAQYHRWQADRIVGEVNNGGDLVETTIRTVDPTISYKAVRASRGKQTRAEPVSALYEQGKVHHCGIVGSNGHRHGALVKLEDQMTTWDPAGKGRSPDRIDALVWGITELMLGRKRRSTPDEINFGDLTQTSRWRVQ